MGSEPCDLIVVLTSLPVDALPVDGGRVVTYDGNAIQMGPDGGLPTGVPIVGYLGQVNKVTATGSQSVQPGDVARLQVAFEGIQGTDNLVILCNGAGQYAAGRRAGLAFDR